MCFLLTKLKFEIFTTLIGKAKEILQGKLILRAPEQSISIHQISTEVNISERALEPF